MSSKELVLKICTGTWENASRDKRELLVCKDLGLHTCVLAKGLNEDRGRLDNIDGFDVYRYTTRPLGVGVPNLLNRCISVLLWALFIKKIKPTIISGHDLSGLTIGWIYSLIAKNKPKLLYDSHEFEIGRNAERNVLVRAAIKAFEGFLVKRCDYSIVVNDSIADELVNIYKLRNRPLVVRNIPEYWNLDENIVSMQRTEFRNYFEANDDDFIIMYHGMITKGRGIEKTIELLSINKKLHLIILGSGIESYIEELKNIVKKSGLNDRIMFLNAVPNSELWKYVAAVDLGMIIIPAVSKSYYYMLPNKLFENVQSGTPVLCSNFPTIKSVVTNCNLGLCCDPNNLFEINNCIEELRTNKDLYMNIKESVLCQKEFLCWEKESKILRDAYERIVRE